MSGVFVHITTLFKNFAASSLMLRRFNLLREESEGYAKLLSLLNQSGGGRLTADTVPVVVSTLHGSNSYSR